MKRNISFVIISVLVFYLITGCSTGNPTTKTSYKVTDSTATQLSAVTTHYKDTGVVSMSSANTPQQVNILTQKCNQDAKLVTWAVKASDNVGFTRKNVADIASDYQTNHPGWKVLGGINADQYYPDYGEKGHADGTDYFYPQPYGCLIADGEKWFAINAKPYGGNGTYFAGFLNNGSSDQILEGRTNWAITNSSRFNLSGLYVTIYDGTEIIGKYKIEKFNEAPGENESSLYSPYVEEGSIINPYPVSGTNLFVVDNAEQAYVSNSITYTYKATNDQKEGRNAQNAFFGKGTITSIAASVTLTEGQFAIDTKNSDVQSALKDGAKIVVQFEYEGPINQVESATAYHTIMRSNDRDISSASPYNTQRYPRSFFGRKADGTMVLIAVDGSQADKGMPGTNQYEGCGLLRYYGVTEAYQMDGGGSVTMVVRQDDDFVVVNSPSGGSPRKVLSALLFVVRE